MVDSVKIRDYTHYKELVTKLQKKLLENPKIARVDSSNQGQTDIRLVLTGEDGKRDNYVVFVDQEGRAGFIRCL